MIKPRRLNILYKAALFTGCFFFCACENDPKVIDDWTSDQVMMDEGRQIQTLISEGSHLKARLTAPLMRRFMRDSTFVEFPETLKVDFYNAQAAVESHLDSKYGKYYELLGKVYLRDSVIAFNFSGDSLQTPELWWDQNSQEIYTDKAVRIRKGGNLIYGVGMNAKQDLSDIKIREVTGVLMVPDSVANQ